MGRVAGISAIAVLTIAVNWTGAAVMASCCALSVRELRDGPAAMIRAGMRRRWFWPAFWISGAAVVVNTLLPLALIVWWPLPVVAGVFAANAVLNLPAVPVRYGLWKVRSDG